MMMPRGKLTIQTMAMVVDTNVNGDLFGGWIVSQMDLAAAVLAKEICRGRAVTVAIHSMAFLKPVKVGNLVSCYAELIKIGTTSMTINIELWTEILSSKEKMKVTEGVFVFVAIDDEGNPIKVPTQDD